MKKLYKIEIEDNFLEKNYTTYILLKSKDEINKYFINEDIKIMNINVDNYYIKNKKLSLEQMKFLCDNLYLMINSDINIYKSISFLIFNNDVDKIIKGILYKVYLNLRNGKDYKQSFEQEELDKYFLYSIKITKNLDTMKKAIYNLKDYYENLLKSKKEIEKSTIYPLTVLVMLITVLSTMNFLIVPQFNNMLDMDINLKLSTYMLITLSFIILIIIIIYLKGKNNDNIYLKTPFLKNTYKNYIFFRFSRDINILIKNNETIYNALNYVLSNEKSDYILEKFIKVSKYIDEGKNLEEIFENFDDIKEFSMSFSLIKNTGDYGETFIFLEKFFYNKFKYTSEKIKKLIEPLLVIILAILIMSLAYEVYSKIFLGGITFL
jgi:type IV pilus assembly protein PilC